MTNYERIKQMSIEEMAEKLINVVENINELFDEFITSYDCRHCEEIHCTKCMKKWLEQEAEE